MYYLVSVAIEKPQIIPFYNSVIWEKEIKSNNNIAVLADTGTST